jgi:hypothetical protein
MKWQHFKMYAVRISAWTQTILTDGSLPNKQTNSVALFRERTIPTERTPLVKEVSVNFCGQRVLRSEHNGAATFSSKQLLNCTHEAEWTQFQTHCFSENLAAPGIEPGHLDL